MWNDQIRKRLILNLTENSGVNSKVTFIAYPFVCNLSGVFLQLLLYWMRTVTWYIWRCNCCLRKWPSINVCLSIGKFSLIKNQVKSPLKTSYVVQAITKKKMFVLIKWSQLANLSSEYFFVIYRGGFLSCQGANDWIDSRKKRFFIFFKF